MIYITKNIEKKMFLSQIIIQKFFIKIIKKNLTNFFNRDVTQQIGVLLTSFFYCHVHHEKQEELSMVFIIIEHSQKCDKI